MGVVVLGAGGRLGRLMQSRWPGPVTALTRTDCDILNGPALVTALRGADAVICLAGVTPGSDRPMSLNVTLAELTLDAAQAAQAGRVFLMSSAAVYGGAAGPLIETDDVSPTSEYGQAKHAMEEIAARHPHPVTCLRIGNVAGADAILGGWHDQFTLDTFADGTTPTRSYVGPGTLADILLRLTAADTLPPILNVAAPGRIAMGDLLDAAGLPWAQRPATDATVPDVTLDLTQLARLVPLDPATPEALVADWRHST